MERGPSGPPVNKKTAGHEKTNANAFIYWGGKCPLFPTFKLSESLASLHPFFFLSGMKAWLFKRATEPLTLGSLSKWDFEAVNPAGRALLGKSPLSTQSVPQAEIFTPHSFYISYLES